MKLLIMKSFVIFGILVGMSSQAYASMITGSFTDIVEGFTPTLTASPTSSYNNSCSLSCGNPDAAIGRVSGSTFFPGANIYGSAYSLADAYSSYSNPVINGHSYSILGSVQNEYVGNTGPGNVSAQASSSFNGFFTAGPTQTSFTGYYVATPGSPYWGSSVTFTLGGRTLSIDSRTSGDGIYSNYYFKNTVLGEYFFSFATTPGMTYSVSYSLTSFIDFGSIPLVSKATNFAAVVTGTPELSTWVLFGTGILALMGWTYRRKKALQS